MTLTEINAIQEVKRFMENYEKGTIINETVNIELDMSIRRTQGLVKFRKAFNTAFLKTIYPYVNFFECAFDNDWTAHMLLTKYQIFENLMNEQEKSKFHNFFDVKYGSWFKVNWPKLNDKI